MTNQALWRPRPIFITSTFRDMHAERDYLRTHVFPVLEERLCERRAHLEPIDLRWGVETVSEKDEYSREMLVLKVCLAEVQRSRPFLIALLGDRYGWIPPEKRMSAAAREADFAGEITGRSITDLEIDYGVLANPVQQPRSLFYFRESLPYEQLIADGKMDRATAAVYAEQYNDDPDASRAAERLDRLKQRIDTQLPKRVRHYTTQWDAEAQCVTGLEAWGQQVLEDLWQELEADTAEYDRKAPATWQAAEHWVLEQFIEARARGFVGRTGILADLRTFANSPPDDDQPWGVCVTGTAGAGKSALFARLYRQLQTEDVVLLAHAAGISPSATQVDDMLKRWIDELSTVLRIDNPLAEDASPDDIEQAFSHLLHQASMEKRVVVLIDALNQFETTTRAQHHTWLPQSWPGNVRLITTAIQDTQSQALSVRDGVTEIVLPPLNEVEAADIAISICKRYHRDLNPQLLTALLAKCQLDGAPANGNALWLSMAVEELNLLDNDDFVRAESQEFVGDPGERLHQLLLAVVDEMPPDVTALYGWLLKRAEGVFGEQWAQSFVNLIALGRAGWRESDLQVLMPLVSGERWDELRFATLRRGFRSHVVQCGTQGQWDFTHSQMRVAILARNLYDSEQIKVLHSQIADHLEVLPPEDLLHETELMVHLIGADDALRAARYYASGADNIYKQSGKTAAVTRLILGGEIKTRNVGLEWASTLPQCKELAPDEQYCICRRFRLECDDVLKTTARLTTRQTLFRVIEQVLESLVQQDPSNTKWEWNQELSLTHDRIGDIARAQGHMGEAMMAYQAGLAINERLVSSESDKARWQWDLSINGLSASHDKIGDLLRVQGDMKAALMSYRAGLAMREKMVSSHMRNSWWERNPSKTSTGSSASPEMFEFLREFFAESDPDNVWWEQDPVSCFYTIAERQRSLMLSHDKIGDMALAQGDLSGALTDYRAGLAICARLATTDPGNLGWERDLSISHDKTGDVALAQGDLSGALMAYRSSLTIREHLVTERSGNAESLRDLSFSHDKIGDVVQAQGDMSGTLTAYRSGLAIRERLAASDLDNTEWQRDLVLSQYKIGGVTQAQGDLSGALTAYQTGYVIIKRLIASDPNNTGWQQDLIALLIKLAEVSTQAGEDREADAYWRDCLETLQHLKQAGVYMGPPYLKLLEQLEIGIPPTS